MEYQNSDAVKRLLVVATKEAVCVGLNHDDAADSAITFVEKWLNVSCKDRANAHLTRVSARNHAYDFIRRKVSACRGELSWAQVFDAVDSAAFEKEAPELCPLERVLQSECWKHLAKAIDSLDPSPHFLFTAHYFDGLPVEQLARETNRSPEAVRKSLRRACLTVRASLNRQGCTAEEFCAYFASS